MSERRFLALKQAFAAFLVIDALILAIFGFLTAQSVTSESHIRHEIQSASAVLLRVPAYRLAAVARSLPTPPDRTASLQIAQARIVDAATRRGCRLGGFQASPDVKPYSSPFGLSSAIPGWSQISIQASVSGSLSSILETFHDLRDTGLLVEPDSVDLSRKQVLDNGDVIVTAQFAFRVIFSARGAA